MWWYICKVSRTHFYIDYRIFNKQYLDLSCLYRCPFNNFMYFDYCFFNSILIYICCKKRLLNCFFSCIFITLEHSTCYHCSNAESVCFRRCVVITLEHSTCYHCSNAESIVSIVVYSSYWNTDGVAAFRSVRGMGQHSFVPRTYQRFHCCWGFDMNYYAVRISGEVYTKYG